MPPDPIILPTSQPNPVDPAQANPVIQTPPPTTQAHIVSILSKQMPLETIPVAQPPEDEHAQQEQSEIQGVKRGESDLMDNG